MSIHTYLGSLNTHQKFLFLSKIAIGVTLSIVAVSVFNTFTLSSSINDLSKDEMAALAIINEIDSTLGTERPTVYQTVITEDPAETARLYKTEVIPTQNLLKKLITSYESRIGDESYQGKTEKQAYETLKHDLEIYLAAEEEVRINDQNGNNAAAEKLLNGKTDILYTKLQSDIDWFLDLNKQTSNAQIESANTQAVISYALLGTITLLAIIGLLYFTGVFSKQLKASIDKLNSVLSSVEEAANSINTASDEMTVSSEQMKTLSISTANNTEEMDKNIRTVAAAVEQSAANVTEVSNASENIKNNIVSVEENCTQVSKQMGDIAQMTEEMANSSNTVAAAVEELSSSVNTVSVAIEEMSASLNEVAKNTSQAARMSNDAQDKVEISSQVIHELGNSAKEIEQIVELIKNIASQTNLLALNATIEAASAGEAGKGFAVVANEVKELAKQSAEASEEIRSKVDAMQNNTLQAVGAVDSVTKIIDEINQINNTIAAAVQQQTATADEISSNVASAALATNEVSSNVQVVADNANNISKTVQEITDNTKEVSDQAGQASQKVLLIANNIQELSHGTNEIAKSTNQVASETTMVTTNVQQVSSAAQKTQDNVVRLKRTATNLNEEMESMANVVNRL